MCSLQMSGLMNISAKAIQHLHGDGAILETTSGGYQKIQAEFDGYWASDREDKKNNGGTAWNEEEALLMFKA